MRRLSPLLILCFASVCWTAASASTSSPATGDGKAGPVIGGCSVFPSDNPWNTDISKLPVHPNSKNYIVKIGEKKPMHPDFGTFYKGVPNGFRFAVVPDNQPLVPISFEYSTQSDPGPYPIPENPPIEMREDGEGDRHMLIVQQGACRLWEVYDAVQTGKRWKAGSGAVFDLGSNKLRPEGWTSADAAGLPILPGLVRYDEVESGAIRHALRFTAPRTQSAYIHPATHQASRQTDPNFPPMGLRLRLKNTINLSDFSPRIQVIVRALQTYGMFLADNGSPWFLSGVHDLRWSDSELRQLAKIHGEDFEAADTGSQRAK
ncbi:MAG: hypothetical protein V1798_06020 [Pseudomonadota bacterium]